MPDPNSNTNDLKLEEVVELDNDSVSEEQRTFLEEHKADLTDEQAQKFSIEKEPEKPSKIEPEVRTAPPKPGKKEEEEEEEEVAPEDKKAISKVVDERLKPLTSKLQNQADQVEADAFIRDNPEYGKYRGAILTYMKHPAYGNIPASNLAKIVAGEDLLKLGAQKEREAQKKAEETKGGGSTARQPSGKGKDWLMATPEEVAAKTAEVLGRRGM